MPLAGRVCGAPAPYVPPGGTTATEGLACGRPAQPHWDAINAYLDAHMERTGTPEQDVALVLDAFAQAAMEAAA